MLDVSSRRKASFLGVSRDPAPALVLDLADADLPCPWCGAATSEADDHCPSCRHRFG